MPLTLLALALALALQDLAWVSAMGPPGGGRNPVDPRYVALYNVYNLTPPSEAVLDAIYSKVTIAPCNLHCRHPLTV